MISLTEWKITLMLQFQYALGYGPRCFRIISSGKKWNDANNYCNKTFHGTLATVNDR